MSDSLLVERRGRVLVMQLNRPQARNAINLELASAIDAAVTELDQDDSLAVGVLTGADGTFCAGMDLKAFTRGEVVSTDRGFAGLTEAPPEKPLIAAVEGWALAGGCELALACDLVVAGRDAKFGIPEVKRGLVAAAGGLMRLHLALPYALAMELALTGDPLSAQRAHELGMVNHLADRGQALTEALSLAERIAENGPLAVRTSKAMLKEASAWNDPELWRRQHEAAAHVFSSADATEGATAFAEKRAPRWTGR